MLAVYDYIFAHEDEKTSKFMAEMDNNSSSFRQITKLFFIFWLG